MIKNLFIESYLLQKHLHGVKILAAIGAFLWIGFLQALNVNSIIFIIQEIIPAQIQYYFFDKDEGIMIRWGIYLGLLLIDILLARPWYVLRTSEELLPKSRTLILYTVFSIVAVIGTYLLP